MKSPQPTFSIGSVCKEGFRRNRIPALILQTFAAVLLALYFLVPELRSGFEAIGKLKADTGIWFALVSTAFFGGFIPWIVMVQRGRIKKGERTKHLLFFLGFWALQGFMVDQLYTLQDEWFGSEATLRVLLLKVLVDQIPFNLFWATPNSLIFYGWKNADFSWRKLWQSHSKQSFFQKYATIQISAWVIWIPAVLMIYSLPPNLQVPLFNLVLCFFSLVLAFISRD